MLASGPRSRGTRVHPRSCQGCQPWPRATAASGLVLATQKLGGITGRASAPSSNTFRLLARDHAAPESTLALAKAASLGRERVRPLAWCSRPRNSTALLEGALMLAVCATPIGNLEDVTLRVLRELGEADLVLCEDTRHTRRLLERQGIRARLLSYHEHNEAARTAELLPRLQAGEWIALVSDAGLPGISDPGARLVGAGLDGGVAVTVLPGASAVDTALVASGFAAERYQFVGFLPRGAKALRTLWDELASWPFSAVAFESPQRLPATLRSLAEAQAARPVAVCRELTKRFEE